MPTRQVEAGMPSRSIWILVAALLWAAAAVHAAALTREQSLKALDHPEAAQRIEAVERLGAIGRMADADALMPRLDDDDDDVRAAATDAIWQIWSRSGDAAIDRLFARGVEHMHQQAFDDALKVFDEIVRRKPAFAEGWNKRATVYFLLGQNERSLLDCDEVLKRNPKHFGALSGAGQIHLRLGHFQQALDYFQRALQVNPNLDGIRQAIPLIEHKLREKERSTT
jgi:tetratricopeptide (TPR) repeat protein